MWPEKLNSLTSSPVQGSGSFYVAALQIRQVLLAHPELGVDRGLFNGQPSASPVSGGAFHEGLVQLSLCHSACSLAFDRPYMPIPAALPSVLAVIDSTSIYSADM